MPASPSRYNSLKLAALTRVKQHRLDHLGTSDANKESICVYLYDLENKIHYIENQVADANQCHDILAGYLLSTQQSFNKICANKKSTIIDATNKSLPQFFLCEIIAPLQQDNAFYIAAYQTFIENYPNFIAKRDAQQVESDEIAAFNAAVVQFNAFLHNYQGKATLQLNDILDYAAKTITYTNAKNKKNARLHALKREIYTEILHAFNDCFTNSDKLARYQTFELVSTKIYAGIIKYNAQEHRANNTTFDMIFFLGSIAMAATCLFLPPVPLVIAVGITVSVIGAAYCAAKKKESIAKENNYLMPAYKTMKMFSNKAPKDAQLNIRATEINAAYQP